MKGILIFTFSMFAANAALADWQYTNWGMTVAEVKTASKGQAQDIPPEEIESKSFRGMTCPLRETFATGRAGLQASLCFDFTANRLVRVSVEPASNSPLKCMILEQELRRRYGGSIAQTDDSLGRQIEWRDAQARTDITFYQFQLTGTCYAHYDAVHSSETEGL